MQTKLPLRRPAPREGLPLMRRQPTQNLQARGRRSSGMAAPGDTDLRALQVDRRRTRRLCGRLNRRCVQRSAKSPASAIQIITGDQFKWQAPGLGPPDQLPPQFQFRRERPLGRQAHFLAPLGVGLAKPLFRQEQLAVDEHSRPGRRMRIRQGDRGHPQFNFAQATVVLPTGTRALVPGGFVRTLIQDQYASMLQRRQGPHLILDLIADALFAPGRLTHKLLQLLAVAQVQPPLDVRVVARVFHGQLAAPIPMGPFTRIARPRPEARAKAFPKVVQVIAQAQDCLHGQSPLIGIEPVRLGSGYRVIRL